VFNVTNTQSATQFTEDVTIAMTTGQKLDAGMTNIAGASATGDTYIRLFDPSMVEVAFNDDYTGTLSFLSHVALATGNYTLKLGAYSAGSASGTAAWEVYDPI
jgi:hypothetical protein